MEHKDMQQLISAAFDGAATFDEIARINAHVLTCKDCARFQQDLQVQQTQLIKAWPDEDLSPDLEQKLQQHLVQREGKAMKKTKLVLNVVGSLAIVLLCVVMMRTYAQKTMQARVRDVGPLMPELAKSSVAERTAQLTPQYVEKTVSTTQVALGLVAADANYPVQHNVMAGTSIWPQPPYPTETFNREQYDRIYENEFKLVKDEALSTFSIDVDTASYGNTRRFLNNNQLPPADVVRIEELINYFSYDYPQPEGDAPFSITTTAATCPWKPEHQLVRIGLQGKKLLAESLPPSNLVFLLDVSGSMNQANKLPLLKNAFKMMVNQLSANERVAIVVYAGAAGTVLESTPGNNKHKILEALNRLNAGGSTAGGAGIKLAYQIAKDNFIDGGNNRIILATDGDFNVGTSSTGELTRLIEEKREEGVFLTVLGFGNGNYQDARMEKIADKGNGNYYYIDTQKEAKKVLVSELGSTLFAIAKDVKIQIEFNPAQVKAYRLIGYENRLLAKEDFNDDTKDAGELGAGHTVTALYEIVPASSEETFRPVDDLVYQTVAVKGGADLMTVKLRYKDPDAKVSQLLKQTISTDEVLAAPQGEFAFASAVAQWGMILRASTFKGNATYVDVLKQARASQGKDAYGYRAEFINLVEKSQTLDARPEAGEGIQFK